MYGFRVLARAIALLFIRFVLFPILYYYVDPKKLRKNPNMSTLSGITNIPFMIEATKGSRPHRPAELHKKHPVIRIGPNSLSYGSVDAIKVCPLVLACSQQHLHNVVTN